MTDARAPRVVAIVQARMASTRLPGKVMKRLGGDTVLAHCLRRCRSIRGVDEVVCATVDQPDCDPIAQEAERLGVTVYRGDEVDVLGRYVGAARAASADIVLRATSDCPVIDPDICAEVIDALLKSGADFATNNAPPTFPHGLDVEVVRREALERAWSDNPTTHDREHVMPAIRRNPALKKLNLRCNRSDRLERMRWTLDTETDFTFFDTLFRTRKDMAELGWEQILEICAGNPALTSDNPQGTNDSRQSTFDGFDQVDYGSQFSGETRG